ncbi:MAG: 16S rRNA (uracil(1498)-N(3))-methyltransferase [Hyphomicrobiaceae bacterium]|nr:16S rRNA (uracil(1498)-N(3))-methyltransferase [Hyphomicrobiaceae bacterium]
MAIHDFASQRLMVDAPLAPGADIELDREQTNYLLNVLRLGDGAAILVFNGRDGEWRVHLVLTGRKSCRLRVDLQTRPQTPQSAIRYLFAPLKRARLDYMVQKAVELGAGHLQPVLTRRTIAERVNLDRMRANAVEAAEQCGVLSIPTIGDPLKFGDVVASWPADIPLVVCDEEAEVADPIAMLSRVAPGPGGSVAVLIGPEGGFDPAEREVLRAKPFTTAISLGPRIMRADTAAVAALSLVNAVLGDWR